VVLSCKAIAFPGLPVIFAEGVKDVHNRVSIHSHVSFALTNKNETARTITSVKESDRNSFILNGKQPGGTRSVGVIRLIEEMLSMSNADHKIEVSSLNDNILTGSSDSGSAALVFALDNLLELNLEEPMLCRLARKVSETAYRSIYGGLSEYLVNDEGIIYTSKIVSEDFFKDVRIFACPFDYERHSADDLHLNVLTHPGYATRKKQVAERIIALKEYVREKDIYGVLKLMEDDAKTVHSMFEESGLTVIRPLMRGLCKKIEELRLNDIKAVWNVAGGSTVYIFCLKEDQDDISHLLRQMHVKNEEYKIAGAVRNI